MTLSEELLYRGVAKQTTLNNLNELDKSKWTFYIGIDASADSLTVGNLASIMSVRTFLRYGHKAIILAGGATSLVGDPGGKTSERKLPQREIIRRNVSAIEQQLRSLLKDYSDQITFVNNLDWLGDVSLLDFLRDTGKHYPMTSLLQRDFVATRIGEGGSGISYAEFSYTLLQGFDYLHLFKKYNCRLQLGGTDQWGNCLSGVDLIRRKLGEAVHVVSLPLIINRATGIKFGKSEGQAIWLDAKRTHPSDFYQFWLNTDDQGVIEYIKIYTALPAQDIKKLGEQHKLDPSKRIAQTRLAQEITKLVHGQSKLDLCRFFAKAAFSKATIAQDVWGKFRQTQTEQGRIVLKAENGLYSSNAILEEIVKKIETLESLTKAKQLLKENALKIIFWDKETSKTSSCSLKQYLDQPVNRWNSDKKTAMFICDWQKHYSFPRFELMTFKDSFRRRMQQPAAWLDRVSGGRITPSFVTLSGLVLHVPLAALIVQEHLLLAGIRVVNSFFNGCLGWRFSPCAKKRFRFWSVAGFM